MTRADATRRGACVVGRALVERRWARRTVPCRGVNVRIRTGGKADSIEAVLAANGFHATAFAHAACADKAGQSWRNLQFLQVRYGQAMLLKDDEAEAPQFHQAAVYMNG